MHSNNARIHTTHCRSHCQCNHMVLLLSHDGHMLVRSTVAAAFVPYCTRLYTVQLMSLPYHAVFTQKQPQPQELEQRMSTSVKQVCQLWRQPVPKQTKFSFDTDRVVNETQKAGRSTPSWKEPIKKCTRSRGASSRNRPSVSRPRVARAAQHTSTRRGQGRAFASFLHTLCKTS